MAMKYITYEVRFFNAMFKIYCNSRVSSFDNTINHNPETLFVTL